MSTPGKRMSKTGRYVFTKTTGEVERKTGAKFGVPSDTSLKKYFTDSGVPGLARVIDTVQKSAR